MNSKRGVIGVVAVVGIAVASLGAIAARRQPAARTPVGAMPGRGAATDESAVLQGTTAGGASAVRAGRWRLAARQDLDHVVLFLSHILVRHRDVASSAAGMNPGDWKRQGPQPARSRDEARARAERIAAEATGAGRDRFAALAHRDSDDEASREHGGSLAGVTAIDLTIWPEVLDVLAGVRAGEISPVVETEFGFHVFRRDLPPASERVAGRRIVIGYQEATWLQIVARDPASAAAAGRRSRQEALAIAAHIAAEGRRDPGSFDRLVSERSEHRDAAQGGDIGVWLTTEPSPLSRELAALAALPVGGISPPHDSRLGVEILQRTPAAERPQYALDAVYLAFEPDLPAGDPLAKSATWQRASALIAAASAKPELLAELQQRVCCAEPVRWSAGRGPFGLESWIRRFQIGDLSPGPVQSDAAIVVGRRLDPDRLPPEPATSFDLPSPTVPDMAYLVRTRSGPALAALFRAVDDQARRAVDPAEGRIGAAFQASHAEMVTALAAEENGLARVGIHRQAMAHLRALLGRDRFDRYQAVVHAYVESVLLHRADGS